MDTQTILNDIDSKWGDDPRFCSENELVIKHLAAEVKQLRAAHQADLDRMANLARSVECNDEAASELAELRINYNDLERAAKRVVASARRASAGQDLVLRTHLLELARHAGEPLHTA